MITLEVIKSSDDTAIGLYEYQFDSLFIGRSHKNDLIFLDRELPLKYITIKIMDDQGVPTLVVKSLEPEPFFFVNGKKVSGLLKIRQGDNIAFGPNQLKIVSFAKSQSDFDLGEAYERFEKSAPDLKFALEFIEEVLIDQEGNHNV